MTGLSRSDGERDRFQIAHLPDHDDIRVFAQRGPERGGERKRVRMHFALRDVTAFRFENVFDRIFQRDDVLTPFAGSPARRAQPAWSICRCPPIR